MCTYILIKYIYIIHMIIHIYICGYILYIYTFYHEPVVVD